LVKYLQHTIDLVNQYSKLLTSTSS